MEKGVEDSYLRKKSELPRSLDNQLSFSIIRPFLSSSGRFLPVFTEKSKKNSANNFPQWGLNPGPLFISLTVWTFMAFAKSNSIASRNDHSPKCELVHETKLTSEILCPPTLVASCFNPVWGLPLCPAWGNALSYPGVPFVFALSCLSCLSPLEPNWGLPTFPMDLDWRVCLPFLLRSCPSSWAGPDTGPETGPKDSKLAAIYHQGQD